MPEVPSRTTELLRLIDEAYEVKTWHGPNLRGSLRGIGASQASKRPAPGRHNIWEIAVHAAYWKYTVRRKILGEKRGLFPLKGSNWFPRPAPGADWKADLRMLDEIHRGMREAIASLDAGDLPARAPGSTRTWQAIVTGVAYHDVYHAGQIQLVKRLTAR